MQMKRLEERIGRPIFERDGRQSRLTDDGERLLDYARRIVRLNAECIASFDEKELVGRVRLGLPDDYADRYLPEILALFSRSNPRAEVTVVCEPTPNLIERVQHGDLDLAIITHVDRRGPSEIVRIEQLYPTPTAALESACSGFPDGTPAVWVQEEPANMGAACFWSLQFGRKLFDRLPFSVVARPPSASPATGSAARHHEEQAQLLAAAFGEAR